MLTFLPRVGLAAYYDLVYVALITLPFLALLLIAKRHPKVQRALYGAFLTVALVSLLIHLVNIKVVAGLGRPLNYQWLYYSDFLLSLDSHQAIIAMLSLRFGLFALAAVAGLLIVPRLAESSLSALLRRFDSRRLTAISVGSLLVYVLIGGASIGSSRLDPSRMENPIASFASSVVSAGRDPGLYTMATSVGSEDFEPARPSSPSRLAPERGGAGLVRNVVLLVLESVPAEYLEPYGGRYPVTPELSKYRGRSALFTNIYAHTPATNYSLVSLLLSIYPWISYQSLTQEYPAVRSPSLSAELKRHDYHTTFLTSGDTRFQRADVFLSHRQFDMIQDYRSLPCPGPVFRGSSIDWPFLDGTDDECIVDALIEWIGKPARRPFFAMLWPSMTHFPYFVTGPEQDFGVADRRFNRYLNALRHNDRVLGKLLRALEERGLEPSTLVVVVGDHGEAFGRHNQTTHASKLYQENVHVPLMLINSSLFSGEQWPMIGGLIDLAPTILDVLGLAAPDEWQGRSLWSVARSGRAYFFRRGAAIPCSAFATATTRRSTTPS